MSERREVEPVIAALREDLQRYREALDQRICSAAGGVTIKVDRLSPDESL